nr:MAG TPA: hypothetical protein [Caudoviricetes sp.]
MVVKAKQNLKRNTGRISLNKKLIKLHNNKKIKVKHAI